MRGPWRVELEGWFEVETDNIEEAEAEARAVLDAGGIVELEAHIDEEDGECAFTVTLGGGRRSRSCSIPHDAFEGAEE